MGNTASQRETWAGLDQANVMSLELLSGILVWGGVGWLLDRWIGSTPWFFAIGVLLGFAGGLYLVWLRTGGARGPNPTGPDDDGRVT